MEPNLTIAGIFLAAGSSTRMGKANKLLLPYKKTTLIQHCYAPFKQSQIDEVVVVTGYQHQKIEAALSIEKPNFTYNSKYAKGMTSSIQTGLKIVKDHMDGFMIALSDMPYLTLHDYNYILQAFKKNYQHQPLIIVPVLHNQRGNPVVFSKEWLPVLLSHQNKEGCKMIIEKNDIFVHTIELSNEHAFKDIDKQADYLELTDV